MAKLILSMDGLVLKEISLTKERTTIGRKPHNDVQIDNLAVSGEHAVVVTILNDSFLEDLGSTNGTLVNGKPIKKHFLQNNDVIELGKYKLKYAAEAGQQPVTSTVDFERTMVLRPAVMRESVEQARAMTASAEPAIAAEAARASAAQQAEHMAAQVGTSASSPPSVAPATVAPATVAPRSPAPVAAVQILTGSNAGRELELIKPLTTLGKPGVQVAVLTRRPHGYFITHVEGGRMPQVNGQEISAAPHPLKDHDLVEIAGVKMEFYVKD